MNLYDILNLDHTCSKKDIKKSYYYLAKIYHPDKKTGNEDIFKKIKVAYEILYDDKLKEDYDISIKNNKITPFSLLQQILIKYNLDNLPIDNIYTNFKNDFNDLNFYKIYKNIRYNLTKNLKSLDIIKNIYFTFEELYNNKYKLLDIKYLDNNNYSYLKKIVYPDPYYEEVFFEKEGDILNDKRGNLIININIINETNFIILEKFDLLFLKKDNEIILPNNEIIYINQLKSIDKYYIAYNKGLYDENIKKRGNLYILI